MKILIIHTAFIGDIVLSTPLLKRIKEVYPEAKITYLTTPAGASILRNNPYILEIIEYDKRGRHRGIKGVWNLGKRLRYENFNKVIIPHRYLRSAVLGWLSRSPERIGYDIATGKCLYTKKIKYDTNKHEVEKLLSFMGDVKGDLKEKYRLELYPSKKEVESIDLLLKNKTENKKIVVLAPGSKWETKRWPANYFNELIDKLSSEESIQIVIIGGKEEKEIELDVAKTLDLRGETTLLELAEVLKRSSVVISNDSSPIHIASAFEKPYIIGIFGPTVEKFGFYPWSKNSEVVENKEIECRPCGLHGSKKCPTKRFDCMLSLKPEMILERVLKVIHEQK